MKNPTAVKDVNVLCKNAELFRLLDILDIGEI